MKKVYLNTLKPEEVIKRLKNGEFVKCESSDKVFYMIDGILVNEDSEKTITVCPCFEVSEQVDYLYFEEEEPFEITQTGFYRTRDGRKVYVSDVENYAYGVVDGERRIRNWSLEGRWAVTSLDDIDIVAKWED